MNGGGDAQGALLLGEQRILMRDNTSSHLCPTGCSERLTSKAATSEGANRTPARTLSL